MTKPAVALLGFNRPDCTRRVFEEIRRYQPTQLFLVADGPRAAVPTDEERCRSVRAIMQSVDWECDVRTNFSEVNLGCKKRMSSGIDWVFSQVEEAIFLEDDCVPSPAFFEFCAVMLARYRDNSRVMHIGGSNFQTGQIRGDGSYYFSIFPHVWGWATWRRAWQLNDVTMRAWPQAKQDNWIATVFPSRLAQEFWSDLIERVYVGKLNSWATGWAFACWRHQGISIIPNANLVTNIGGGPDATHTKDPMNALDLPVGTLGELRHPRCIEIDREADLFTFEDHYGGRQMRRERSVLMKARRFLSSLKRLAKKLLLRS